jgi:DNA-binding transcriptional ArsR family regulator
MEQNESEQNDTVAISDKVEILSTEDQKIKAIGEILSSDSSRQILRLLFNDALSANQISQKTGVSLPLVIYHLKKMQEANVVKITNVGKNTKSHDMKFYTADKFAIVILPEQMSSPAKKSKSLLNSFSRIHRLATLGAACIAVWFSSQVLLSPQPVVQQDVVESLPMSEMAQRSMEETESMGGAIETFAAPAAEPSFTMFWSVIAVLSVIIGWLTIEIIIKHKESKIKPK